MIFYKGSKTYYVWMDISMEGQRKIPIREAERWDMKVNERKEGRGKKHIYLKTAKHKYKNFTKFFLKAENAVLAPFDKTICCMY